MSASQPHSHFTLVALDKPAANLNIFGMHACTMNEVCLFCSESLNQRNKPTCIVSRGHKSIISKIIEYGDELHKKLTNISSIIVHVE